jgi:superfamily II DNA or RNA helicase
MSEVSEFLDGLKPESIRVIAGKVVPPKTWSQQQIKDAILSEAQDSLENLISNQWLTILRWNEIVENDLRLPRRRSFSDLVASVRTHLNGFFFRRNGVWKSVSDFLEPLPKNAEAIWVTYSFQPSEALVGFLGTKKLRLRVLCADPHDVSIERSSFTMWSNANIGSIHYLSRVQLEDGPDRGQHLHAKALLVKEDNTTYKGLVGSFNLAIGSLYRNTETVVQLESQAETWWQEAERLLASPSAILLDENAPFSESDSNSDSSNTKKKVVARDVILKKPPRDSQPALDALMREAHLPQDEPATPDGLRLLRTALDEFLKSWPQLGPSQGWQYKAFNRLWRQMEDKSADVLYLPVGVGKTFIALRWLLRHFKANSLQEKKRGLFLVPNEWVARSVKADVAKVIARAYETAVNDKERSSVQAVAGQLFNVQRPSEFDPDAAKHYIAVVADECHNWRKVEQADTYTQAASKWTYQTVLDRLRSVNYSRPRILGLSATPCRMELKKFDVEHFLREFCERQDTSPMLSLSQAIARGLLAPYEVQKMLAETAAEREITALLNNDTAEVEMGDYNTVVLRNVWEVLNRFRKDLLDEIDQALNGAKRVLVFMPPVKDDGDRFVRELAKVVTKRAGTSSMFFDFRDRTDSDQTPQSIFESFKTAPAQTGKPAVLVTVNRFSEGVSINDIDAIIFLRATLSPRLAVQALGRGLRLDPNNLNKRCKVYDAVRFKERFELWER